MTTDEICKSTSIDNEDTYFSILEMTSLVDWSMRVLRQSILDGLWVRLKGIFDLDLCSADEVDPSWVCRSRNKLDHITGSQSLNPRLLIHVGGPVRMPSCRLSTISIVTNTVANDPHSTQGVPTLGSSDSCVKARKAKARWLITPSCSQGKNTVRRSSITYLGHASR